MKGSVLVYVCPVELLLCEIALQVSYLAQVSGLSDVEVLSVASLFTDILFSSV